VEPLVARMFLAARFRAAACERLLFAESLQPRVGRLGRGSRPKTEDEPRGGIVERTGIGGDGEGRWRVLAAFGLERFWSWIAREDESARPLFRKAPRVSSVFAACAGWRAPRSTCPGLKRSVVQPCEQVLRRQLAGEATLFLWPCGCDVA